MKVEVVTPSGTTVATDADEVVAPGVRGEFGILPGHTPFISALKPGVLSLKSKGGKRSVLAVGAGYAEVNGHDQIVVLTQQATPADEVDAARAQKELEEAEKALAAPPAGSSPEELHARRDWAQARLDARNAARG
jgi:F-type H+-transporting ATPase subunit epsilon